MGLVPLSFTANSTGTEHTEINQRDGGRVYMMTDTEPPFKITRMAAGLIKTAWINKLLLQNHPQPFTGVPAPQHQHVWCLLLIIVTFCFCIDCMTFPWCPEAVCSASVSAAPWKSKLNQRPSLFFFCIVWRTGHQCRKFNFRPFRGTLWTTTTKKLQKFLCATFVPNIPRYIYMSIGAFSLKENIPKMQNKPEPEHEKHCVCLQIQSHRTQVSKLYKVSSHHTPTVSSHGLL